MRGRTKQWLIGGGLLAMSLLLLAVYANGQWEHTTRFLIEWVAH